MALGGCEESTINYSHAKHSERGLKDCNTCHAYSEDLTPKWPKMAKCLTCHIKNYDTNHPESCLLCHTRPGATINVRHNIPKKYRDLKFAHKIHLENKVECNQCHEHIEESNDVTPPGLIPDMFGNCVPCHKKEAQRRWRVTCVTKTLKTTACRYTMKTAGSNTRIHAGYKDTEANFITTRITASGATTTLTGALTAIRSKNRKATITPGAGKPTDLQHPGNGRNAAHATRRIFANGAIPAQNL